MTQGIEFLETIYEQLHEAGIVRSKGEFSERLLDKSPSYLTSMRAKRRTISGKIIMDLGDNLMAEIVELGSDPSHAKIRAVLRRAVAQVNNYLADQTIPAGIALSEPMAGQKAVRRAKTSRLASGAGDCLTCIIIGVRFGPRYAIRNQLS